MTSELQLFTGPCDFVAGVASLQQLPVENLPEAAFIGRSNVGKSSLINAITQRKKLARTSNTPGRTQQLNFFNLGGKLMLVDLPGYGYAKASRQDVAAWTELMRRYLCGRSVLRRVFVLIDSRHGLKPGDVQMMEMLDEAAVSYQLVLTKMDKVKSCEQVLSGIAAVRDGHPALYPDILATSSEKGLGIAELRHALYELIER